jgi:dTDP-4-amino-4,6-dideoxygalactose transaminase
MKIAIASGIDFIGSGSLMDVTLIEKAITLNTKAII